MKENKTPAGIKSWAEEDRPREKLLSQGHKSLTNSELIAILLGSGSKNHTAVELARKLLNNAGNTLAGLGKQGITELTKEKGMGQAKAITIIAAMELGRRRASEESFEQPKIISSAQTIPIFRSLLEDLQTEEFYALFLSRSNRLIEKMKVSSGGVSGTVVDVRVILKRAVELLASGIIVGHNHPSGNRQASDSDIKLTKQIGAACALLDIRLLDHIIIAGNQYLSFADEGFALK